jgi:outer membrane protein assembly factor BamB
MADPGCCAAIGCIFCSRAIRARSLNRLIQHMSPITTITSFCLLILAMSGRSSGQEWTRFRGPNGTGISQAKTIPTRWSEKDFNWKADLPGTGHSSPVLWGDRIFLTSTGDKEGGIYVLCVDASDGRIVWRRNFSFSPFSRHKFNSFASSTPAVDKDRVYIAWTEPARYTLRALDHEGKDVWERDLGPFVSQHGGGTSPVVLNDKVILGNEQDGASFIIAVDAKSGKTIWQTPRKTATATYSTPCLYEPNSGKPALIFNSQAHGIYAVDPYTGKTLWEYDKAFDKRSVSSPTIAGDIIFGSCGSGQGGMFVTAIKAGDAVSGRKPELAYHMKKSAPYVPTAVAVNHLVWLWSDAGFVTCLDVPSGEIRYQERVGGNFFGSPVWVDKRLFCVSTSGEVVVLEASDKFNVLARYRLDDLCHTTPAVARGRMFIRTEKYLFSVGGPSSEAAGR